jgi:uncharacterized protein (DUF305 family)
MSTRTFGAVGAVIAYAALAGDGSSDAEAADGPFLAGMKPHHEAAIEMAEAAQGRAQHPEIKQLATSIIADQSSEIETIESIHERLFGEPLAAGAHSSMGLNADQMGMGMDPAALRTARPFDREFIDMMIPHHQGAIQMARIELADGDDAETKALAEAIIEAQSAEITAMNSWRQRWYGAPSPAGGVPPELDLPASPSGMECMEH